MGLFGSHARVGASAASSYEIDKSLRFNSGDSATLTRTFGTPTNTDKYTWSCWLKRTKFHESAGHFGLLGNEGWTVVRFTANRLYWRENGIVNITASRKWRDPGSWSHIVLRYDSSLTTSSDRAQMWIDGVRETDFVSASYPSQDQNSFINSAIAQVLGGYRTTEQFIDGYLAEIHFVDGQGLDPDNFGKTDVGTGQWIPIEYTGTYGNNGYYLKFDDTSALGTDSSGNGNNWTPNNFSVTAGVGNDSLADTPTNNHATLTPLKGYGTTFQTPTNGLLDYSLGGTTAQTFSSTAVGPSGKWYVEITATTAESGRYCLQIPEHTAQWDQAFAVVPQSDVRVIKRGSSEIYTSITSISNGDIIGIALDCDNNTAQAYMNGTSLGAAFSLDTVAPDKIYHLMLGRNSSGGGSPAGSVNFGQRAFSHQPTGFKAWNTANLPIPTIKDATKHFNTVLYTGNGAVKTVTGVGFQTDLLINKRRDTANVNLVVDSVRGVGNGMSTGLLDGDYTSRVASFNADGFVSDNGSWGQINADGGSYVAWNWKESASAGLDIVAYTGNGTGSGAEQTIAHNLGVVPEMIIVKARTTPYSGGGDWIVYHKDLSNPSQYFLKLNTSDNEITTSTDMWNQTAPTSSNFSVGYENQVNKDGVNHVAYVFAGVEGFSKIGKYVGNGSATDGVFVYLGFKPAFLLMKRLASENWVVADNKRDPDNAVINYLLFNTDATAADGVAYDFLSNGVKFRGSSQNENGASYVYIAFAERPFKYSNAR